MPAFQIRRLVRASPAPHRMLASRTCSCQTLTINWSFGGKIPTIRKQIRLRTAQHILSVAGTRVRHQLANPLVSCTIRAEMLTALSVQTPAPATIRPNSSISRIRTGDTTNFIFFQDPSGIVKALQPDLSAENSTWGSLLDIGSAVAGPGSKLATATVFQGNFTTVPNLTTTEYIANLGFHVFLQADGSNITEYIRSYKQGQWVSDVLPGL